jgi:hypothetical protein
LGSESLDNKKKQWTQMEHQQEFPSLLCKTNGFLSKLLPYQ